MDLNSIINMATATFDKDGDGQLEMTEIMSALGPLLAGGQQTMQGMNAGQNAPTGGLDLASLVNSMQQVGLSNIVQSWLGDGANEPVSGSQLQATLGEDKINAFAQQTGMSHDQALSGLQDLLPNLVDQSSQGGQLLSNNPNNDALAGLVGNLIGGLFKR